MNKMYPKGQMQSAETGGSMVILGTSIHHAVNGMSVHMGSAFCQFTWIALIILSSFLILPS